jgi:microcystin-dependent protein
MASPFLSEIRLFSFNFPPKGWAFCNGQFLPINQNQALFSLLGTTFGGNGQTTFALPNYRGRIPMHPGNGHNLGEQGGQEIAVLNVNHLPTHTHLVRGVGHGSVASNVNNPEGNSFSNSKPANLYQNYSSNMATLSGGTIAGVGGNQPHTNMQPYLAINFCIALQGIFPSQN